LFDENRDQIAAVIMMTFEVELASHGFFEQVRDVAHDHGAVFVLDEMRSGFRMALGGAQEYFGVQADLSTFSKAMANGYAVSAVTGKRELMEGLRHTHMSSTYYANPVEMAAAIATIKTLRDTDVIERLWDLGQTLQDGLSDVVRTTKLPATVVGYAISPFLLFARGEDAQRAKVTFFAESTRRGVLLHPNHQWFLSAAHTLKDVEDTIAACEQAASIACGRVP
jgi:glutamate-1-semialdehyde aminotransferase